MSRIDHSLNSSVLDARLCGFVSLTGTSFEKVSRRCQPIHLLQNQMKDALYGCDICFEDGIPNTVYSALRQILFDESDREALSAISDYAFINNVSAGIQLAYRISPQIAEETVLLRLTPIRFLFKPIFILYVSTLDLYAYH